LAKFRKHIQNLQREFDRFCLLINDLVDMLQPKVNPKPLEVNVNQEGIQLTPHN